MGAGMVCANTWHVGNTALGVNLQIVRNYWGVLLQEMMARNEDKIDKVQIEKTSYVI